MGNKNLSADNKRIPLYVYHKTEFNYQRKQPLMFENIRQASYNINVLIDPDNIIACLGCLRRDDKLFFLLDQPYESHLF